MSSSGRTSEHTGEGLQSLMDKAHIPGVSMTSIVNGNIVRSSTTGIADSESKARATTDTIFWACSLSKPVFSYLVFKLMERNIIAFNLDTPLWEKFDDTNYFGNTEGRKK
jgi:CubicO group peptidase (beta-lactamase class C family)